MLAAPAVTLDGDSDSTPGTGFAIVNAESPDVPPPGAGVTTDTCAVPAAATSDATIDACSCVPLTNDVGRSTPFQRTTDALTNPLPFTMTVNADAPAVTLDGDSDSTPGIGFAIVNGRSADVPPPGAGVHTDTCAVPVVATSDDGITACSWLPLTNVVARAAPFQRTIDALTNPLPFTVTVNADAPAVTLDGDSDSTPGTGFATVNAKSPEVPPPGAGVDTDTCAGPAAATSDAAIDACNCVALTNVVGRLTPFQRTTDALANPLPVTVTVNAGAPAVTLDGDSDSTLGTGFSIVNARSPDVPPPGAGVTTDTCAVPAAATSDAEIDACSCVPLTNVVGRVAPFQRTTDALTNPLPFTVRVNAAAPAVTLDGDSDTTPGTGFAIVNVRFPEAPPPGAGVNTDTCAGPPVAISAASIAAWSSVELTNVVIRFAPFHRTTDHGTNWLP